MGASMVRPWAIALALVAFGLMASQAAGYTITVDGQVSDWGIDPNGYWTSDWDPYPGTYANIGGSSEDYRPGSGGYVNPGWGGQTYDAEAFYFTADEQYAYFCVVTGFPPGGTDHDDPGDIAIDINRDGTWDFGIETTGDNGNVVGGLYTDVDWHGATMFPSSSPAYIMDGVLAWDPDFTSLYYSALGCGHYAIETAVPLAELPLAQVGMTAFRAHWTMECGNDEVDLDAGLPPEFGIIPEPGTTTLLSGGVLAMLVAGSRKRKRARRGAK